MLTRRVVVNVYQDGKTGDEYSFTFTYPECNIMFRVSQTESKAPDSCFVKIDGVSRDMYSIFNLKQNGHYAGSQRVEVYYGYNTDLSLVFSGTIDRVMYTFNGGSQTLMMNVSKNTRKFANMLKTVSLSGKQSVKSAVDAICREYGYVPRYLEGDFGSISVGRYCATTNFSDAINQILPKDYGYYTKENDVIVYHKDNAVANEITVWGENGLLAYPTEDSKQEKTTIRTILMPNIESGMKIKIPVDDIWFASYDTGTYKTYVVENYVSLFQNGMGTTEFECQGGLGV